MSIIVKGIKMPENCKACIMRDGLFCMASDYKRISYGAMHRREEWCPMVALPDHHGRLVDADALEELFREAIGGIAKKPEMNGNLEHMVRASAMVIEMIQDAPTIEPRKKGKWIDSHTTCSECGWQMIDDVTESPNIVAYNFCPNCGARMEGE